MRSKQSRIIVIVLALVLIAGLGAFLIIRDHNNNSGSASSAPELKASETPVAQVSEPIPQTCPTNPQPIDNPTKFEVLDHTTPGSNMKMISVGFDAEAGAAGVPPSNEGYTLAWYNEGPKVGSDKGKVVLTSHTFQFGGAFGNDLLNGEWTGGEVIKISDDAGNSACYRYNSNTHVFVDEYDPDSTILYDDNGDPMFALIVCSDYLPNGETLGRMIYYGSLLKGDQAAAVPAEQSADQENTQPAPA